LIGASVRGVENDNSQRLVRWDGWGNRLLRQLRRGLWRCALRTRHRLPPRLQSPRANKVQNEEEEESSAAHSHEDTRINR
jgi:hypothetical protein